MKIPSYKNKKLLILKPSFSSVFISQNMAEYERISNHYIVTMIEYMRHTYLKNVTYYRDHIYIQLSCIYNCMKQNTTIRVTKQLLNRLRDRCKKGESYNDFISKILNNMEKHSN